MRIKEGLLEFIAALYKSRSKKFVLLNAAFLIGVAIASILRVGRSAFIPLYACAWGAGIACMTVRTRAYRVLLLIAIGGMLAGIVRFAISEPPATPAHINFYNGLFVTFTGVVGSDPLASNQKQKIILGVERVDESNNANLQLPSRVEGNVAVYAPQFPERKAGDELTVRCVLEDPREFNMGKQAESFHKDGIWAVCDGGYVTRIAEHRATGVTTVLNTFRTQVNGRVERLFNEPYAGLLAGILYGARTIVSPQLLADFQRTGLSHVMAISGYNITIVVAALSIMAVYAGIRRQRAFWIVTSFILLFVIFTGATASVVRAGIMGFLVLLARQMGRASSIYRVLLLSASFLVLINPRILLFDVGFQLSYLSTIGLVYGVPILERYCSRVPEAFGLKEVLLSTFAALIATTPLILFQFGRFSVIAPISNVLVLPFIPLTMALGFAAIVLSFLWMPLGVAAAYITWVPLAYIVEIVTRLSRLDFASFPFQIPLIAVLIYYAILIYILYTRQIAGQIEQHTIL